MGRLVDSSGGSPTVVVSEPIRQKKRGRLVPSTDTTSPETNSGQLSGIENQGTRTSNTALQTWDARFGDQVREAYGDPGMSAEEAFSHARGTTQLDSMGRGLMGDFSGEIIGALSTPGLMLEDFIAGRPYKGIKEAYTRGRDYDDMTRAVQREVSPGSTFVNELGGAVLAPGVAAAKMYGPIKSILPQSLKFLSKPLTASAAAGSTGYMYGLGREEDDGRLANASTDARYGAVLGPVLGAATGGVQRGYRGLRNLAGLRPAREFAADMLDSSLPANTDRVNIGPGGVLGNQTGVTPASSMVGRYVSKNDEAAQIVSSRLAEYAQGAPTRTLSATRAALNSPARGSRSGERNLEESARKIWDQEYPDLASTSVEVPDPRVLDAARRLDKEGDIDLARALDEDMYGLPKTPLYEPSDPSDFNSPSMVQVEDIQGLLGSISSGQRKGAYTGPVAPRARTIKDKLSALSPELRDLRAREKALLDARDEGAQVGRDVVDSNIDPEFVRGSYDQLPAAGKALASQSAAERLASRAGTSAPGQQLQSMLSKPYISGSVSSVGGRTGELSDFAVREQQGLKALAGAVPATMADSIDAITEGLGGAVKRYGYQTPAGATLANIGTAIVHLANDGLIRGVSPRGRKILADLATTTDANKIRSAFEDLAQTRDERIIMDAAAAAGILNTRDKE